jgi:hypothetical protein
MKHHSATWSWLTIQMVEEDHSKLGICMYNHCYTKVQDVYKLSEYFAKPYFHKYWTEVHYVTTIWKRNVCSFVMTLNAFNVRPTWHGRCPGDTPIPAKPSQACLVWCFSTTKWPVRTNPDPFPSSSSSPHKMPATWMDHQAGVMA